MKEKRIIYFIGFQGSLILSTTVDANYKSWFMWVIAILFLILYSASKK